MSTPSFQLENVAGYRVQGASYRNPDRTLHPVPLTLFILFTFYVLPLTFAQKWSSTTDGFFTVQTASRADATYLKEVFEILQETKRDLRSEGLSLPESVTVQIHPNLDSYTTTTELPWCVLSLADRETSTIHTQRLRILLERQTLNITLRHELFHLAQPDDWPRWRAEGEAMKFSGERTQGEPFEDVTEEELNNSLANPDSRETLQRAAATAYLWVVRGQ
ncbi:MAG: hypothetical protein ACRCYY_17785 [Trueperaceae bacterium]